MIALMGMGMGMGTGSTATGWGVTQGAMGTSPARTMNAMIVEAAAESAAVRRAGVAEAVDGARAVVPAGMRSRMPRASACSMRSRAPSDRPR